MKFDFSSKAVRVLGSIAVLSMMVGTSVQPVQAQSQRQVKPNTGSGVACVPLRDGEFFVELQGITFTPKQAAAYEKLSVKVSKRGEELAKKTPTREIPGAAPVIEMRAGAPAGIGGEIAKAQDEMIRSNVSPDEQLKLLTQRYGQYAKFYKQRGVVFTPETLALREKIQRANQADLMAILRPDQRKVYRANLVRASQIEACNPFKAG